MNEPTRVALIEDHEMVRAGFRMLIESQPDMLIAGEAGSGDEGLDLLAREATDVMLLDISMPGLDAAETARILKTRQPDLAILVVSIHTSQAYLLEMLDAGVDGYLPKRAAAGELIDAIRTVRAGQRYIHPDLVGTLVDGYRVRAGVDAKSGDAHNLTPRQRQVLRLVAAGLTSQQIGEKLGLSARTVERHIANIMGRLGVRSRIDLVKYAIRTGLVDVDESGGAVQRAS